MDLRQLPRAERDQGVRGRRPPRELLARRRRTVRHPRRGQPSDPRARGRARRRRCSRATASACGSRKPAGATRRTCAPRCMALADATREIRAGDRERRLVVSMLSSFAARWVTPRIGSFIEAHPQWDLELLSTNALTDFARDDVDVAIRFGFGKYSGLHSELLLEEIFFPACAPNFNGGNLPKTPAGSRQSPAAAFRRRTLAPVVRRRRPHRLAGAEARRAVSGFVESAAGGDRRSGGRAHAPLARHARDRGGPPRAAIRCGWPEPVAVLLHLPAANAGNRAGQGVPATGCSTEVGRFKQLFDRACEAGPPQAPVWRRTRCASRRDTT